MTLSHANSRAALFRRRNSGRKLDPRIPLTAGTELAAYRIGKVLGSGSFSVVYDAVEIETGLRVAVKEYFPKRFAERKDSGLIAPLEGKKKVHFREGMSLFYHEARALEKIRHPNVLNMHSLFRANKTAYLVSANQGGRDLKWFLSSLKQPLDQALIYKVFMPILSALNCLHTAHLLHLDIKPANILLQPNGKSLLLDFGAAQAMGANREVRKAQVISHGFAPPEQYGKNQMLGPWSDIYALAATLYFSMVGKMPGILKKADSTPALNINRLNSRYTSNLLEAINQALSYDATTRFASIDDFSLAFLSGSQWASLREYELLEMNFDRDAVQIGHEQDSSSVLIAA